MSKIDCPVMEERLGIVDAGGNWLCHVSHESDEQGASPWLAEIVRRVNLHDELVAMLQDFGRPSMSPRETLERQERYRALLAKAEAR